MNYFGGSPCGCCPNVSTTCCPMPTCGCAPTGSNYAIILVLFILLVIIIGARFIS
ncbi:MAG: YjcZ family sporulation protein [Tenericutes bacterium]|jgi:uncharacterized protein (TIGR01732 family)|nr:YjcZ family sporulation protein [Mycoplasmatota bacterium]